jgi:hypothetical protein
MKIITTIKHGMVNIEVEAYHYRRVNICKNCFGQYSGSSKCPECGSTEFFATNVKEKPDKYIMEMKSRGRKKRIGAAEN